MAYIILAQICLAVGTPHWVVTFCYICFGIRVICTIIKMIAEEYLEMR